MGIEAVSIVPHRSRNSDRSRPLNIHKIDIAATDATTIATVIRIFRMVGTARCAVRMPLRLGAPQRGVPTLQFLSLNVIVHLFFENLERQRAVLEQSVVELALIELSPQFALGAPP